MRKIYIVLFLLLSLYFKGFSQTTYDWLNTAPDGNWKQGAFGARWNPGGLFDQPSSGAIYLNFNNTHQTNMTNNVPGTYNIYGILFGSFNTNTRTISGNDIRLFDASGTDPKIENQSAALQNINLNMEADGDAADPLELNPLNGDMTLGGTINLYSSDINVYGDNGKRLILGGVVSGAGKLIVKQNSIVQLDAVNTYSGSTELDKGELWINTTGDAIANNNIFIGNGSLTANVAKIFLSRTAGGTNFTRSFTMNPGALATRFIGSLNTSGTNEFSGVITNNSANGLEVQVVNAGGTLRCSNIITGTSFISKIGAGILEYSGTTKSYTGTTIINSGILRLAAAEQINVASRLQLNGGIFSTGATTGFTETLGQLELTENSTIALGTGASTLTFAASDLVPWTAGKTLTITGWNGACNGNIFVGNSASGLTAGQLAQINFTSYGTGAAITASGELRPAIFNNVIVNSTTGTATAAGYATVGAAFTAINGGTLHTGAITISIFNNTSEAVAASLNQVAGVTSLLIVPAGCGARTVTGPGSISFINLFGADNVTINGLNTDGNSLTISNPNTTNDPDGSTIRFQGDASNNTVTNCTILGSSTNANATIGGTITFSTGTTTGNDNNTISYCNIGPAGANLPRKAIFFGGTSAAINNNGNIITNNNIYDYFNAATASSGLYLTTGTEQTTIENNKFYQTATRTSTTTSDYAAIQIANTTHGQVIRITGNTIGFANSTGTGTSIYTAGVASKFFPIIFNGATAMASTISGNTIAGISVTTSSSANLSPGIFTAIRVDAGLANINNNIIGTSTGNIVLNTTTGGGTGGIYGIISAQATGTPAITNNTISYIFGNATGIVGATYGFFGINTTGAAAPSVSGNTIGGGSADIIRMGVSATSTGNSFTVRGILSSSTGSPTISNNTINNISIYTTSTTGVATNLVRGIETSGSVATTITGNTISNIKNTAPGTGSSATAAIIGIFNQSSTGIINISSNNILSLSNTNAGAGSYAVTGIRSINGAASAMSKNKIYSLSSASTAIGSQLQGIQISGGTWTISNNMIRLGVDAAGTAIGGNHDMQGINAFIGTNNIYHNSVYLGGAASGAQVTYAIQSSSSNIVKNNIIVNSRSSATANTQIGLLFGGTGATAQDANLYYAPNAGGLIAKSGATNYATLTALRGLTAGRDVFSVNSDPKFISAIGNAATVDLHINAASASEVESGGVTGLGITDDIDALNIRCPIGGCPGTSTRPDIGADEGLFTPADLTPPVVAAFTIPNQANTTAPTVSVAITDNRAVSVTAGSAPRIYFKRCTDPNVYNDNTTGTLGWKYVESTTGATPFSFTLDYTLLNGGSVAAGTFINYFIVAQDAANNVGINSPLTFASTPANINLATANLPNPVNFPNYVIQITGGAVTIGSGGTFTNITGACGCFAAVNASTAVLTANIDATVTSDLVEDNANQLTATGTSAGTAFVLNITPSAAAMRTISTTIGGANPAFTTNANMIGISGNSKVNINGNFSGAGQYLTFRSTNTTPGNTYPCIKANATINTGSPITTLTVANCILETNSTDNTVGHIYSSNTGATILLSVTGNDFRDARGGTTGAANTCVFVNQGGSANTNLIENNKFYNFTNYGVYFFGSGVNTINANRFYQENSYSSILARPIYLGGGSATTHNITDNIIGGNDNTNAGTWTNSNAAVLFEGISIAASAPTNTGTISGNVIRNISLTGTGASSFSGISSISGSANITGNTIGDATTANSIRHAGTGQVSGIYYSNSSTTSTNINTNTIGNITTNTTTNSFGFVGMFVSTSNITAGNIQGNIIKTINVAPSTTAASAAYGINIGSGVYNVGTTTANDIDGISNSGDGSALVYPYTIGILTSSTTGANTIQGNTITNLTGSGTGSSVAVKGIWVSSNAAHKVLNNTISNLISNSTSALTTSAQPSAAITGIHINSNTSSQQINNNTIFNLSASSATGATNAIGINFTSGVTAAGNQIGNNKIYDVKNLSASGTTARVIGINMQFGGNIDPNAVTIFNNMVSLNNNNASTDNRVIGIRNAATTFNKYYYNSVNIYGAAAGSATMNSYAFLRDATPGTVDLKNNIFQNLRTGGTGKHHAIGNTNAVPATGWISTASNYNDLFASNTANVGEWGAGTFRDFGEWKTSSGGDGLSVNSQAYFANATLGDLHLAANNCALDDKGTIVAITTDYDGTTRSGNTDIGADEFTSVAPTGVITVTGTNPICTGSSTTLEVALTGLANWSYTYTINGASPTVVNAVATSPNVLTLSPTVNTTYALTNLTSGSCVVTSGFGASAMVIVSPTTVAGTVSSNQTICSGSTPAPLTLSGNVGAVVKWQSASDAAFTTPTDIANTTNTLTLGAVSADTYYRAVIKSGGCLEENSTAALITASSGSLWLGVNTNWNNTANWCNGTIPTGADNVTLPSGVAFYPIIPSGQVATTGFLDIAAGASMQVTGTGVLNLFGNITNAGILDLVDGTLRVSDDGSGLAPTISISGLSIKDKTVKNFIVATYVEISNTLPNDTLKVTGLVSFLGNNNDLVTHDNLTLVSNAAGTASIGDITNGAFMNTGNTITGKVIIERYLPGIKAWRLLATPIVVDPAGQTITDSWREGGLDLTTIGYGTRVTGADGPFLTYGPTYTGAYLDEYTLRSNMKSYNMVSNNFTDVLGIDIQTNKKIANDDGYFIFVRGDRTTPAVVAGAGTSTTLRIKGEIRTGNQTFGVDPLKFRSIGNPFPSRLDMRDVYLGGIKLQSFYVWNPAGVGSFNAGQYVGYTFTGTNFTNGAAILNYIESGQAFFVQNNDPGALNLVIKETDKTTGSANVSRGSATSPTLEIKLHSTDANGTEFFADGTMLNFENAYSNGIDNYDVKKITNSFDNVAIKSNATSLLVERKTALVVTDSIHLNMSGLRTANYKFEIDPSLLVHPELTAYLKDRFLQTETEVSLTSVTNIDFATTADAASKAANRFVIFFRPSGVLPVTFVDIAAIKNANKTHTVKWAVANELNIQQYDVERSSNGINFVSIGSTVANQQSDYNLDDAAPLAAINFYRVKATSQSGQVQYSAIVKLTADAKDASIALNTNPVNNGQIVLGFYNQQAGQYQVAVYNNLGQLIESEKVFINGNAFLKTINMGNNFKGNGNIVITNLDGVKKTIPFVSY